MGYQNSNHGVISCVSIINNNKLLYLNYIFLITDLTKEVPATEDTPADAPTEPLPTRFKKYPKNKLTLMKLEEKSINFAKAQQLQETEGPLFNKVKLKKPAQKPKQEASAVTLPKFQLKSRITYIKDWPPNEEKSSITFLGSVRQNGELSRNVKEAMKLKKKVVKIKKIPDLEKTDLEKPEKFEFTPNESETSELSEPKKEAEVNEQSKYDTPTRDLLEIQSQNEKNKNLPKSDKALLEDNQPEEVNGEIKKPSKLPERTKKPKISDKIMPSEAPGDEKKPTIEIEDESESEPPLLLEEIQETPSKPKAKLKPKLMPMKIEQKTLDMGEAQHAKNVDGTQFTKLKLKKTVAKPKQEPTPASKLPKFQLKSRIKRVTDWPPEIITPLFCFLGSVKQNGILSRNVKEAAKIKKKVYKEPKLPEIEKTELEKPMFGYEDIVDSKKETDDIVEKEEEIENNSNQSSSKPRRPSVKKTEKTSEEVKEVKPKRPSLKKPEEEELPKPKQSIEKKPEEITDNIVSEKDVIEDLTIQLTTKPRRPSIKTTEEKTEDVNLPKSKRPSVKKTKDITEDDVMEKGVTKDVKEDVLEQHITKPRRPSIKKKEEITEKAKKPTLKQPSIKKTEEITDYMVLEKDAEEDLSEQLATKPQHSAVKKPEEITEEDVISETNVSEEDKEDIPEQFTIKPRRPSVKKLEKSEDITEEVTIKKKLKPLRKSSVTLPEITEPETVTFRPKTTQTKEDVEQEFNIQLDSYAEEEISMSSKVKLKPRRQPTFEEEADETSIKFYEKEVGDGGPDIVEIIESDIEDNNDATNVMLSLKKIKTEKKENDEISSTVILSKPKDKEEPSEIVHDVSFKLDKKPKYTVDDQEEVSYEVKPQKEPYSTEELSLSSKIKLKLKKKPTIIEASDETSIKLIQETDDSNEPEEIIVSDAESEENVQMVIRRQPKKPAYEVSEVEELSVEFKPKFKKDEATTYQEEQLTISAKRKPRKPSQIQGN